MCVLRVREPIPPHREVVLECGAVACQVIRRHVLCGARAGRSGEGGGCAEGSGRDSNRKGGRARRVRMRKTVPKTSNEKRRSQ